MTWVALGAAGVAAAGSVAGGVLGSSAAGSAANASQAGANQGILSMLSGQQAATGAIQPYAQTGGANNSFLAYLMGQGAPTSSGWTSSDASQLASLQQIANAVSNQSNFSAHPGDATYLTSLDQQIAQLQAQQQGAATATQANQQISSSGLPQGYFTQAASNPFSYNPLTDTNLQGANTLAAQEIAAQKAAGGGFGSGNMASSIANETATLEPQYEQMALGTYQQNYNTNPNNLYNMISGQSQSGQNASNALANIYTGGASNIAQLQGTSANAAASGILGASNASTNALSGLSNALTGGANTYSNLTSQQQLAAILQQLSGSSSASTLGGIVPDGLQGGTEIGGTIY